MRHGACVDESSRGLLRAGRLTTLELRRRAPQSFVEVSVRVPGVPNPVTFRRWDGSVELAVDRAIQDTRSVIYPLHGLDAYDPRD